MLNQFSNEQNYSWGHEQYGKTVKKCQSGSFGIGGVGGFTVEAWQAASVHWI